VGGVNERSFEANKNDERPAYETFKASFDGSPEIKLLMLDLYQMRRIEEKCRNEEQLITEINRLKAENEQLKNNQTLTSSEKQERLQQNQQKLEQIASYISVDSKPNNSNNNFLTGLVVGGTVLAIVGLISVLVIMNLKKKKSNIEQPPNK
ncbi:3751_t:CDS:2, partial [Ambispora gerdemannii]